MAYSYVDYTGNGATVDFTIPFDYLNEGDVGVSVDGAALTTADFIFHNATTIRCDTAPGADLLVRLYRVTNRTTREVDFSQGAVLTEDDLDRSSKQMFFLAQEAFDAVTGNSVAVGTIGAAELSDGAVGTSKLADSSVSTAKLQDESVTFAKMDPAAIAAMLGDSGVDGADIDDGTVTLAKLSTAVQTILNSGGRVTGEVEAFALSSAPSGWVKANGSTIGDASSSATLRANADTSALFAALWGAFANTELAIQDSAGVASTRGASAALDYAAHKRLPVPDLRGEFIRGLDDSRGIDTGRVIGTLQLDAFKAHTHTGGNVAGVGLGAGSTGTSGPTGSTGGTETRPRNVALLYCIKL